MFWGEIREDLNNKNNIYSMLPYNIDLKGKAILVTGSRKPVPLTPTYFWTSGQRHRLTDRPPCSPKKGPQNDTDRGLSAILCKKTVDFSLFILSFARKHITLFWTWEVRSPCYRQTRFWHDKGRAAHAEQSAMKPQGRKARSGFWVGNRSKT